MFNELRIRLTRCVAVICALTSCSPSSTAERQMSGAAGDSLAARRSDVSPAPWSLTFRGIGPIRFGMTVQQAGSALGTSIQVDYEMFDGCDMVDIPGGPSGVSLMVVRDTVVRVDVRNPSVATRRGVRIGDGERRVRQLYGSVVAEPHEYTNGKYLIATARPDTTFRLVFETDEQGRVTTFRGGLTPAVHWVEGCA